MFPNNDYRVTRSTYPRNIIKSQSFNKDKREHKNQHQEENENENQNDSEKQEFYKKLANEIEGKGSSIDFYA